MQKDIIFALKQNQLVCFPTETVYALAANATDEAAVQKIYTIKKRSASQPLSLLVKDITQAQSIAKMNDTALTFAKQFWPGPLTMILPLTHNHLLAPNVNSINNTIGIRIPNYPKALEILEQIDFPLVATSLNLSGQKEATTQEEVQTFLENSTIPFLAGGTCSIGTASTIIDLTHTPFTLLREGVITKEMLDRAQSS